MYVVMYFGLGGEEKEKGGEEKEKGGEGGGEGNGDGEGERGGGDKDGERENKYNTQRRNRIKGLADLPVLLSLLWLLQTRYEDRLCVYHACCFVVCGWRY